MRQIVELERMLSDAIARAEAAEEKLKATEAERAERQARIERLDNQVAIACADGNWNYAPYMHGMANGLLVAQATMKGGWFTGLDAPDKWLRDRETPATPQEASAS